jgi:hypothetical protein
MEKQSGLELDWYKEYWVNSTKTIDYAVGSVLGADGNYYVTLKKIGDMPMPVEVTVKYADGSSQLYYIPLRIMRGEKNFADNDVITLADWPWVNSDYTFEVAADGKKISEVVIDNNEQTADMERSNNVFDVAAKMKVSFE